jgi:hypothetical protein
MTSNRPFSNRHSAAGGLIAAAIHSRDELVDRVRIAVLAPQSGFLPFSLRLVSIFSGMCVAVLK